MNEFAKKYRLDESLFFYDYADGLAIVINSMTGIYYGINSFGSAIFNQLILGASPNSIIEKLHCLSNCPHDVERIFADFMNRLQSFGILMAGEEQGLVAQSFDETIALEGFTFEIEEFADIQEILLADPIHDVNSVYGWPVLEK